MLIWITGTISCHISQQRCCVGGIYVTVYKAHQIPYSPEWKKSSSSNRQPLKEVTHQPSNSAVAVPAISKVHCQKFLPTESPHLLPPKQMQLNLIFSPRLLRPLPLFQPLNGMPAEDQTAKSIRHPLPSKRSRHQTLQLEFPSVNVMLKTVKWSQDFSDNATD